MQVVWSVQQMMMEKHARFAVVKPTAFTLASLLAVPVPLSSGEPLRKTSCTNVDKIAHVLFAKVSVKFKLIG
jgi:hypothetical protein